MARKRREKIDVSNPTPGFGGQMAELLRRAGVAPEHTAPEAPPPEPMLATPAPIELKSCGKIVLRKEKKGRAGKTVTRVELADADDTTRKTLAGDLKRALGVGATVEGDDVIVQGDQRERTAAWLRERGARVVI